MSGNATGAAIARAARVQQRQDRREALVRYVETCGRVRLSHLARRADVSERTIRRDLAALSQLVVTHRFGAPWVSISKVGGRDES